MTCLTGQKAMITGGGAGIGRATAIALAKNGADIAIFDLDSDAAEETCSQVRAQGRKAVLCQGSVSNPDDVTAAFSRMDDVLGPLSIMVNNAGISGNKPTLELTDADWERNIGVNLNGVFYCSRAAGRRMKDARSGVIINVGSIYSLVAPPNRLHYCAPKAAVEMMTRALAVEWAQYGIRVNGVAPGYVQTQLLDELVEQGRVDLDGILRRTPQGALPVPDEIADAIMYLCDPRSRAITGHMLPVDGGWTAYGFI